MVAPVIGTVVPVQYSYIDFPTYNSRQPPTGAKQINIPLSFAGATALQVDLTQAQQQGRIDWVQTIYVDNANNAGALTIQPNQGNREIIPPGWQGYFPISCPNPPVFVFSTPNNPAGPISVTFFNVPIPALAWPASQGALMFTASGALIVSDPILDACVVNNTVQVSQSGITPQSTSPYTHSQVNSAAGGDLTLVPAVVGKKNKLYKLILQVGAPTTIQFFDGASGGADNLSPPYPFLANQSMVLDADGTPWYESDTANTAIVVNSTNAVQVSADAYSVAF